VSECRRRGETESKERKKKLKLPSHSRSSPVEDFVVLSHTHTHLEHHLLRLI